MFCGIVPINKKKQASNTNAAQYCRNDQPIDQDKQKVTNRKKNVYTTQWIYDIQANIETNK